MRSDDSASAQKEPLIRNPTIWLIVSTLFLLLGQAAAAPSWVIPPFSFAVLLLPLLFLFWPHHRRWAGLALLAGLCFSLGYVRHRQIRQLQLIPASKFIDNYGFHFCSCFYFFAVSLFRTLPHS